MIAPGLVAVCLTGLSARERFLGSMLFFTIAWSIAFPWNAFHPVPATALSSVVALFCMITLLSALSIGLSMLEKKNRILPTAVLYFSGIYIWDFLMMKGPMAMPGTMLGLSVSDSIVATIWAPIVGSVGLTALVLVFNFAWIAALAPAAHKMQKRIGIVLYSTCAIFLPMGLLPNFEVGESRLNVVVIQPGSSPEEWAKVDDPGKIDSLTALLREAKAEFPEATLFILPETALPILDPTALASTMALWSDSLQANVLTGGILKEKSAFYNIAALGHSELKQDTTSTQPTPPWTYRKRRLIPFVESVPFGELLPFSDQFLLSSGGVSAYEAGTELGITSVAEVKIGVMICFESFFPSDAIGLRNAGSDVLVVLTQDGWWRSSQAKQQHEHYTRLLALSSGVPIIQASVDGISAIWDGKGNKIGRTDTFGRTFLHASVPMHTRSTPYQKLGDTFWFILVMLSASLYLFKIKSLSSF